MDYTSLFDPIPWKEVGQSVVQTVTLYWLLVLGIKAVGRRVFAEMGPQEIVVLFLISEACDLGLTVEKAGYWGSVFSVLTILAMGTLVERILPLRHSLESHPVVLYSHSEMHHKAMQKYLVDQDDLNQVAREYGLTSFKEFEQMTLECDGSITGTLRSNVHGLQRKRRDLPI